MRALPYPYASWPKLTRREHRLLAALRSYCNEPQTERALQTARHLLGRELSLQLGIGEGCGAGQLVARWAATPGLALVLEQSDAARPSVCAVELSYHAAQQLVDLALGGDPHAPTVTSLGPLDELSQGALAYVFARVLAALGGAWTLRDCCELSRLAQQLNEDCVVCPITLELAPLALTLRAYVPERLAQQRAPLRVPARSLADLPVTLIAYAGSTCLALRTARALELGDVIIMDETGLSYEREQWRGSVSAGLPGSRDRLQSTICEAGLRIESMTDKKELGMSTGQIDKPADATGTPTAAFSSDTPIELQVEIARFSLSLGELQRLQKGDVLLTGRRIGERVSVTVSGQTLAAGELVDVEGEVGVRILDIRSA